MSNFASAQLLELNPQYEHRRGGLVSPPPARSLGLRTTWTTKLSVQPSGGAPDRCSRAMGCQSLPLHSLNPFPPQMSLSRHILTWAHQSRWVWPLLLLRLHLPAAGSPHLKWVGSQIQRLLQCLMPLHPPLLHALQQTQQEWVVTLLQQVKSPHPLLIHAYGRTLQAPVGAPLQQLGIELQLQLSAEFPPGQNSTPALPGMLTNPQGSRLQRAGKYTSSSLLLLLA